MKWIGRTLGLAIVWAAAWTAYANVFSDDADVRARAEHAARGAAGCGDTCKLIRADGARGVLAEKIAFTFQGGVVVNVTCRRPYLALGDYTCDASKP